MQLKPLCCGRLVGGKFHYKRPENGLDLLLQVTELTFLSQAKTVVLCHIKRYIGFSFSEEITALPISWILYVTV